jgi:hypothetical protein
MTVLLICVSIGSQLLLSALTKLQDFSTFLNIFNSYPIPGFIKSKHYAYLVIFTEILFGLTLLSLNEKIIWFGLLGTAVFILFANILIALRLKKGEKKFRCGCGESLNEEQNAVWLLASNFALIVLALFGLSETVVTVSLFSKEALYIFLAGWGALAAVKLIQASFKVIFYIRQWKAFG